MRKLMNGDVYKLKFQGTNLHQVWPNLAIQKSKNLAFPVFRLQFDQTWAKIASDYLLPLAPSIFSYPGKRKFLNFLKNFDFDFF